MMDGHRQSEGREDGMTAALARIRLAVRRERKDRLTTLYHHVYNVAHLREAYFRLKREAAPGVDGETWQHYGQDVEAHLQDLSGRLRRGAYRATPVRRVYIPKPDGRQRPLGVPALEDKIVRSVTAQICSTIWEEEFLGFSYGFRPGRSPHNALDALTVGIERKRVNWVLDADIRGFFDLWGHDWRKRHAHGDVIVVRYADDFVLGFQHRAEAEQFQRDLTERLQKFHLELHADKTRLIEFGRFAATNRERRGEGKPETFTFLGFLHICGKTRKGWFTVLRQTMRKRLRAKLKAIKVELKRRWHDPIPEQGKWLRSVVLGHFRYYGVPRNGPALCEFRYHVVGLWKRALERRSQKARILWEPLRVYRLARTWLPYPHIYHPYPSQRLHVTT